MNREIKFRVWDKNKKEWYGASSEHTLTFYGFALFGECTMMCMPSVSYLKHLEITEFTGLTDKNGKEIYEGDIVKIKDDKPMLIDWSEKFASFVIRKDGWMYAHWFGESCEPNEVEIIGNIYENPELLELPTNSNA